ncbi:MerR family transcriptional regulator [Leucobacter sp. UCD-THU]|uniref:TOBE domain-containing protein n=1 Tax=Leucobacter sp. UCD-THU TaxID=1292023 RepID=UPI00037557CC|nr:TOBE domain-containing protein [Leucobacter sp. UCD-THU]EYT52156.1 MerR family transcriptional regulator [Leucobacter sp. UCD-THU]
MSHYRIREAARLIGVSDDTIRRWVTQGLLESSVDEAGVQVIEGASLAGRAKQLAPVTGDDGPVLRSARNSFTGIVTRVDADGVVAVVEAQCGPHRLVSIMTREAVDELGLEVGSRATAIVKATNVIIETPRKDAA